MFDNYQDWASSAQEIKLMLAKWVASPMLYSTYQSNYLETNVTEVTVLNTAGSKIAMTNLADKIKHKEPYAKKYSYDASTLYCMHYDSSTGNFTTSGCDTLVVNETTLLCQTCDATTTTITNTSHCYCNSLEYVVSKYIPPTEETAESDLEMVYPDYFALQYWRDSMGWNLAYMALITYSIGLVLIIFCDQFPRRRMLVKIYETIKRREIIEGYTEEDDTISSGESGTSDDDEDENNKLVVSKLHLHI